MTRPLAALVCTALAVCAVCVSPLHAQSLPADPKDLVRLAQTWWGTPLDKFPARAGLKAGDFSQEDHPDRESVKVIIVEEPVAHARWNPGELPPFEFDFPVAGGLDGISGFIGPETDQIIAALAKRYGKATQELSKVP